MCVLWRVLLSEEGTKWTGESRLDCLKRFVFIATERFLISYLQCFWLETACLCAREHLSFLSKQGLVSIMLRFFLMIFQVNYILCFNHIFRQTLFTIFDRIYIQLNADSWSQNDHELFLFCQGLCLVWKSKERDEVGDLRRLRMWSMEST